MTDFSFSERGILVITSSIGFVIALALNDAFVATFKKLKLKEGLGGMWLYATTVMIIGLFLIWVLLTRVKKWIS